jgi:hypothetical protein
MPTLLFTARSTSTGQWNNLRHSFIHRNRPCEIALAPEGKAWVGQRAAIMRWYNGRSWIDVMVPPLDDLVGPYPGTYGPDTEAKEVALDAAATALTDYLCRWIDTVLGPED